MNIPDELTIMFNNKEYSYLVFSVLTKSNIQSEKIFMGKNYNDIYNVFKSYIAYEYQSYESTEEKIVFLAAIRHEIILYALVNSLIKLIKSSYLTEDELSLRLNKDIRNLRHLSRYSCNPNYNKLSCFDESIGTIILNTELITKKMYRYNIEDIIMYTKCFIVSDYLSDEMDCDIITSVENGSIDLNEAVLNAFEIYKNGIRNENEVILSHKLNISKLHLIFEGTGLSR